MHSRTFAPIDALLLSLSLMVGGCTDDEGEGPVDTNGTDLPTDVELVTSLVDRMISQLRDFTQGCRPAHLIDPDANEDAFDYFTDEILEPIFDGAQISFFYGTWADTSASTSDGTGVVQISVDDPPNAIRLQVAGTDSIGFPIEGDLTLSIERRMARGQAIDADVEIVVREPESGDTIEITGTVTATGDFIGDPTGAVATIDVTGEACASEFALTLNTDPSVGIEATGFYLVDAAVGFVIDANTAPADSSLTGRVWMGSEANPQLLMTISAESRPTDCATGEVFVFGAKQGDIISRDCQTDSAGVFVAFEADTVAMEDLFRDFLDLLDELGIGR